MPYVGYVEFNVPDEQETAAFYSAVFGWEPTEVFPGYLNVQNGDEPGVHTGIARLQDDGAAHTVATLLVPDLDAYMEKVADNGGTITVPRFSIPGVGYATYFTDPNGMTVGMWEMDTSVTS